MRRPSNKKYDKQVGHRLRKYRVQEGLSADELARRIGVKGMYLRKAEAGVTTTSIAVLERVSRELNINVDSLFQDVCLPCALQELSKLMKHSSEVLSATQFKYMKDIFTYMVKGFPVDLEHRGV